MVSLAVIPIVLASCFFMFWKPQSSSTVSEEKDLRSIVYSLNLTGVAILDNQTIEMPPIGEFSILFIDGDWLQKSLNNSGLTGWISSVIISGRPTFIFKGEPYSIYDLAGLTVRELDNSTATAGGCLYSESKSESNFIYNTSLSEAVEEAYVWATERIRK